MGLDVLEQIDDLFSTDQNIGDETGSLALVARLLKDFRPQTLMLADNDGKIIVAWNENGGLDFGLAREFSLELIRRFFDEPRVVFEKFSIHGPHWGFGLRLPEKGIFGGLLERMPAGENAPEVLEPILETCGDLLWNIVDAHQKNKQLETRVRHLTSEHDTIKESLEQSIATAIEEHERRIRDQQNHVLHLEEEVECRSSDLRKAMEKAEEANNLKTQFLANMSHELRTPLHGILSFANFGIKKYADAKPEKILDYFEKIQKSGKTLLALLNDLLDLAKLEAGKMTFEFNPGHLGVALLQVVDEFGSIIAERKIKIDCEFSDQNEKITFDGEKIKQVARNLLSNAIKFSPDGGTVRLGMEKKENLIQVSVRDQGPGIPENELETVFDKFVQSSKTKSGAGGTGLGLAICREIIAAHQGRIWAQNNPEGGAQLSFELPISSDLEAMKTPI